MNGVSIRFFCAAMDTLSDIHGERCGTPEQIEQLRAQLEKVEETWKQLTPDKDTNTLEAENVREG